MNRPDSRRWLTLAACLVASVCAGIGYAWSVFLKPLSGEFGWSASDVSLSFTALVTAGAVANLIAGKAQQYVQPRTLILSGGALLGAGLVCLTFVHSLGGVYAFAFLAGIGMGAVYPGGTMTNVIRFFPERRGMASGLLTAGYGMGAVLWAPVSVMLIDRYGLTGTLRILGVAFFVMVAAFSRLVQTAPHAHRSPGKPTLSPAAAHAATDRDWKAMMRTADFYVLALLFVAGTLSGMMVIGQASPIAQQILGLSPASAGLIVSVLALGMVAGKIGWAVLSDKVGRYPVFVTMLVIAALALLVLAATSQYLSVVLAISAVGLCYGGFLSLMGPVTAEAFGARYLGVNFGVMFFTVAISAFAGPRLAALVTEANDGDYTKAFVIAAFINVAGLALVGAHLLLRRREGVT